MSNKQAKLQLVVAIEEVVQRGIRVEDREFAVLTELLMIQLLKLDSIEAEGEGGDPE
ncbi:hypothetical protein RND71_018955 [Anisodus tanguticus]|uniref:BAG domain-containing protein n=1 Tax=Anisodus tanguticus TaxID=243964 RepID=A0AAE1VJW7_9SOLA|nr:hypothetical protein RND71_018955 [Anisodus tanguticus]